MVKWGLLKQTQIKPFVTTKNYCGKCVRNPKHRGEKKVASIVRAPETVHERTRWTKEIQERNQCVKHCSINPYH